MLYIGRYICLVFSLVGDKSRSFSFNVFVFFIIVGVGSDGSFEDVIVIFNSFIFLVCEVYLYFLVIIIWFKDGIFLEFS